MNFTSKKELRSHHAKQLKQCADTHLRMTVSIIGRKDCDKCCVEPPAVELEAEMKNQRLPYEDCPMLKRGYRFCSTVYGMHVLRGENGLPLRTSGY